MTEPTVKAERYLHYHDGGSNKGYVSLVLQNGAGWLHTTRWGGVGKSFQTKELPHPTEAAATAAHEKVVKEKIAKGYRDCDPALLGFTSVLGATIPTGPDPTLREREWIPMLFAACSREQAMGLLEDPHYLVQRKMDGERRRLACRGGVVTGYNRRGLTVPVPGLLQTALIGIAAALGEDLDLDGEVIGNNQFHAFDLLSDPSQSAEDRARSLYALQEFLPEPLGPIWLVPTGHSTAGKRALYEHAQVEAWEGLVFKHKEQPYFAGRSTTNYKWRQWLTATVLLTGVNRTDRSEYGSFRMEVFTRTGDRVGIGSVSGGFSQAERERMGALIRDGEERLAEIRYLHFAQAALFQPCYLRERWDLTEEDVLHQPLFGQDGRRIDL